MTKYPFMKYDPANGTFYRVMIDRAKDEPFSYHLFIRNVVVDKRELIEHLLMNDTRTEKVKGILAKEGLNPISRNIVFNYIKANLKGQM